MAETWQYQIHKFGRITAAHEASDIWSAGTLNGEYKFLTTAQVLWASSDDSNDTVDVEVEGLDAGYMLQKEVFTLDGLNFVPGVKPFLRVFRAKILGSTEPLGNIYISGDDTDVSGDGIPDDPTDILAHIESGANQTLMAIYTTPADFARYEMWGGSISVSFENNARVEFVQREEGGVFQVKNIYELHSRGGSIMIKYGPPLIIKPKTDIKVRCSMVSAGPDVNITAAFDIVGYRV